MQCWALGTCCKARRVRDKENSLIYTKGRKLKFYAPQTLPCRRRNFQMTRREFGFCSSKLELHKIRIDGCVCTKIQYTGAEAADPCVHDQNCPYTYIRSCTRIPNVVNPWKPKDPDFLNWYGHGFLLFGERKQNPGLKNKGVEVVSY